MMIISLGDFWKYYQPQLMSIIVIICALILGLFLHWVFSRIIHSWLHHAVGKGAILFKRYWLQPLVLIFLAATLSIIHPLFIVSDKQFDYYTHIISLLIIGFFTWSAIQITYTARDFILGDKLDLTARDDVNMRRIYTKMNILVKVISVVAIVIGVSLGLMLFPKIRQVGVSILASAGIAGIIVGFAAQKSLGSILAGIQIAFTQPIRIGDEVVVEKEWGVVEEIALTYVVIRVWDKRRLIVPINYFIENIFQNWTRTSTDLLAVVFLEVDYMTPVQKLRDALSEILKENKLWDGRVNILQVTDAKSHVMELRILISALNASDAGELRAYVREKLIAYLQENYPNCLPKMRVEIKDFVH